MTVLALKPQAFLAVRLGCLPHPGPNNMPTQGLSCLPAPGKGTDDLQIYRFSKYW